MNVQNDARSRYQETLAWHEEIGPIGLSACTSGISGNYLTVIVWIWHFSSISVVF